MPTYYPQAAMILRVTWEDYGNSAITKLKNYTLNIVPKSVKVTINNYKEADKFNCTLDYKSFPFDPRAIRALGVSIFMENMKALDTGTGRVLIKPSQENVIFQGFADEETIEFNDSSREITFEGRDFTSILIDRPFILANGVKPTIPMDKPIDQSIQELLNGLPEAKDIKVVNRTGAVLPNPGAFGSDLGNSSNLANQKHQHHNDKYWDLIQDLVSRMALIAYIEIDKLVITKPRVLYNADKAKQMIYGKNLSKLTFKRKLGRLKGFNISVKSLDFKNKAIIEAKIPEMATDAWIASMGIPKEPVKVAKTGIDGQANQEVAQYHSFFVPEILDQKALIRKGESIFEEVARQEIEGTLTTHEMLVAEVFDKNNTPYDVTKIRNGTPIAIEIAQEDLDEIGRLKTPDVREEALKRRGYKPDVARALALTLGKYPTVFYTRSVSFSVSDNGFEMDIEFINFIKAPK